MTTMTFTFDNATYRDLYKDAYGSRPSEAVYSNWKQKTDEQKQVEWEYLCEVLDRELEEEKREEDRAVVVFEQRVGAIMETNGGNRAQAIRWMKQAENCEQDDEEYFEYLNHLPYGYLANNR